jgi:hypothetical protein
LLGRVVCVHEGAMPFFDYVTCIGVRNDVEPVLPDAIERPRRDFIRRHALQRVPRSRGKEVRTTQWAAQQCRVLVKLCRHTGGEHH